jgi:hypothetical protein
MGKNARSFKQQLFLGQSMVHELLLRLNAEKKIPKHTKPPPKYVLMVQKNSHGKGFGGLEKNYA